MAALQCPSQSQVKKFIKAVKNGDITWHAGPMNMQMESLDQSLLEFGIRLGDDLDKSFNITRKFKTLSQRDVPGSLLVAVLVFALEWSN